MLQQRFAPMLSASRALSTLAASDQPLQALPVTSQDEIGELIGGFNQLLQSLQQRDQYQRALLDNFPFAVWLRIRPGPLPCRQNAGFARMFGARDVNELVGKNDLDIAPCDLAEAIGQTTLPSSIHDSRRMSKKEILAGGTRSGSNF